MPITDFITIVPGSTQSAAMSFISNNGAGLVTTAPPVQPTTGAPFSAMYTFGDSLTDAGNVHVASLGILPAPPYSGTFSNGPVWAQDVAQHFGLPLGPSLTGGTDFAYGGAQTGQRSDHTVNPTDFTAQVGQFAAQVATPQPNGLYALWIGSNDVLTIANNTSLTSAQQVADVKVAVANEVSGIEALAARGAKDFVVLNVPDLGKTPYEEARPIVAPTATSLAALYDTDLAAAIHDLTASGALRVDLMDTFSTLDQAIANPAAYGFTDATTPAWTGNLTDSHSGTLSPTSGTHLFFDELHPTAQAHALLAAGIESTLVQV
jgi:phospholipase/lecithinase/hemolysin